MRRRPVHERGAPVRHAAAAGRFRTQRDPSGARRPAFLADPALDAVQDLIITGSGGPFRNRKAADLRGVSVEEAVNHPVWSMGAKISIDSATLMNKTLELIEAKYLFSVPAARLKVLIHPQSIVHGLVRFKDGSVLAQMATPDMRVPIAVALAWPRRIATPMADLDLAALATLTFEEPDTGRFPALRLAREVLNCSGTSAAIVNAANEFAVDAFMRGELRFTDIVAVCEETLARHERTGFGEPQSLEEALDIDRQARAIAAQCVAAGARGQGGASVGAAAAR